MTRQITEIIFGTFILVLAVGFGFYAFQKAGVSKNSLHDYYVLDAEFSSAEGVRKGSEVRMAGIKIGQITGLQLDLEKFVAQVRFAIDSKISIPDDSTAAIASEGLLGGTFVEIMPGGSFSNLADGGQFAYTQGAVSLLTLFTRFANSGAQGQ